MSNRAAAARDASRAALRAGVFGNFVDQVHIFLPLVALAPALPTVAGERALAVVGSWVVVATLLGRPVGAMVFGPLADRVGRTATTRVAILGTAACTAGIAVVPSHASIGIASAVVILLLRFLGGVFLAGEYTAAIPLAMEWSPPRRRGLVSGLIMAMAPWAQAAIAGATAGLLWLLGPEQYAQWGWRVVFGAGAVASLGVYLYYARSVVDEPGAARRREVATAHGGAVAVGVGAGAGVVDGGGRPAVRRPGLVELLVGRHARSFWQVFGLMTGLWCLTNMVVIAMTGLLGTVLGLGAGEVSLVMAAAAVAQALVMSVTGHLSTLTGRRVFFMGAGLVTAVAAPVLWWLTLAGAGVAAGAWGVAVGVVALQVVTVTAYGPVGAYLSERWPAEVRSTGYGTAYSLSIVLPALWPVWLPWVQGVVGERPAEMAVLAVGGLLVAGCGLLGPALRLPELHRSVEEVATSP
ncbi:MFS transporter [Kytococcus sedentarius]|uniref:MFS transporter n=1 Tax=Kytococcus sedentarius TaxID=1276 RepID=UPI0019525D8D|nr:MFS transporter [Kytococcus sedentarius]QRO86805.1 MFS transporter [Kytococcus sedentarius]